MQMLRPCGWALRKLPMALALFGVGAGAFCWGRWGTTPRADAQPSYPTQATNAVPATPGAKSSDYSARVVATLYNGSVPVTREELGEYLIARFGAERLDFLVNRKIVEMECAAKGVVIDDSEVRIQLQEDLRAFGGIGEKDFVNQILKRFNKTLYEWKEDVIRPKLMIAKLVRPTINVTDQEVRNAFEAKYGPKVECRMLVLAQENKSWATTWAKVKESREAFIAEAKSQFLAPLAARDGMAPPIHKHFGDPRMEQIAFSLKEGEVSGVIDLQDGTHVILMCERHLPADEKARYEDERMKLHQEVTELKLALRIPEVVKELRQRANPQLLLTGPNRTVAAPVPLDSVPPIPTDLVPASGTVPGKR